MAKITDIKPQLKSKTRCNIYLDNAFYCGLEMETVMKYRLKIGDEIDCEKLDKIQCDSEYVRAMDKALTYLSKVKKTKSEVIKYLQSKGYTSQTVDKVIAKLIDYRYIDDFSYAEDYIRVYSKNSGKKLITMKLRQKGISSADIEKAFAPYESELNSATGVAEKYLKNKPKDKATFIKCCKYLLSKGFNYEDSKKATEKFIKDEDDNF